MHPPRAANRPARRVPCVCARATRPVRDRPRATRWRSTACLCALLALAIPAAARAEPDVRVPPGTRADAQGQLVSGRGLRDTSDFLARELARRGIAVHQVGPQGVRGVELTRFVSQTASTPWLAIHVLRTGGKTLIFFVPRPKSATTP